MNFNEFEFRVVWQQRPHVQHPNQVMFVISNTKEMAESVARDEIERKWGIDAYDGITVHSVAPYIRPLGRAVA